MRVLAVVGVVLSASCSYGVSFHDCQVGCTASGPCPDGFSCGAEALCRAEGAIGTCAAVQDATADTGGGPTSDGDGAAGSSRFPGIYVTSFNADAVIVFASDATGSATPLRTISGGNTGIATPVGIAIDHAGNIYVASISGGVTVYPGDADGDVAAARSLEVAKAEAIAISSTDDVFVATQDEQVFHFPPGEGTSDRNFTAVATGGDPYLALDEAGDVVLTIGVSVETYASNATGHPTPTRSFTLPASEDIAPALVVTGGAIAVTEQTGEILVFGEQTTGSAAASSVLGPPQIVHGEQDMAMAVDASSGSPVFYVGGAQATSLFEVATTGSGDALTAGTVRSITLPAGVEVAGIAVAP